MVPTLMVFDVARSRLPSWLKSPTIMFVLPMNAASRCVWNVPSPLPSKTLAVPEFMVAMSSLPSLLKSPTSIEWAPSPAA